VEPQPAVMPVATIPEVEPQPAVMPVATTPTVDPKPAVVPPVRVKPPIAPPTPSQPPAIDQQPPVIEQPIETDPPVETIVQPAVDRTFVGIIDTGFAAKNPDFDYSKVTMGRDRIDKDSNPLLNAGEGNEHGTFSWGLVSAIQGNDIGIDGYNDQANVYLSRAIGSGEWDLALTDFVTEAKGQKKKNAIALLPLDLTQKNADGSITTRYEFTARERAALENARQNGVLLVVAAGNDGGVMSVLGQSSQEFDNIITVGSSDGFGRSDYSSYGYGLDILVPGGSIDNPTLSTVGDDVGQMAGTSASAAIAAGMASKVWDSNPALSSRQIIDILTGSAIDLKEPGWDQETGFGVVNFNKAVQVAKETAPQAYIPALFSNPTTWGLEGQVTPLERATADQFNGKSYDWVSYTIQDGDNLSTIALNTMGDGSQDAYNFIAQHNRIPNPDLILAGAVIEVPKEASAPVDNPGPGTTDPGPGTTDPGPGTSDPGSGTSDPGSGTSDPGPVITDPGTVITDPGPGISNPGPTQPSNSINLNGHTVGGNFYPVFQNYQGTLGNPISDVTNYNGASYQKFENGSIVSSQYGTFPLYGGIRQTFLNNGGLEGWLGEPKSGEKGLGNGNIIQYFEDGYIYWNGSKATAYRYGTTLPKTPTNIGSQLGVTMPNFNLPAYRENNIFWQSGYAPASTHPSSTNLGSALGNCTWYVNGRLQQLGYSTTALNKLSGNAYDWDNQAAAAGISMSNTPQLGDIAQWESGHVAVVEKVNPGGTILISESSYTPNSGSAADYLYKTETISASSPDRFIRLPSSASGNVGNESLFNSSTSGNSSGFKFEPLNPQQSPNNDSQVPILNYWRFDKTIEYMYSEMKSNPLKFVQYQANLPLPSLILWNNLVSDGQAWDHKPKLEKMLNLAGPDGKRGNPGTPEAKDDDFYFPIRGDSEHEYFYDIWSNIHYGYVGSAVGFDRNTLQLGSFVNDLSKFRNPFDLSSDEASIDIGIDLWKIYKLDLTTDQLRDAILAKKELLDKTEHLINAV
ncbi:MULTISPECIES: S8 family serine peptidase, partial [unclassified Microcoleus]